MPKPTGVHHLAISTADIKAQVAFFTDVLAMELVAMYPMHGAENAIHAFLRASDHCYIAFVTMPQVATIPVQIGVTHSGWGAAPSAPGTMQHIALNADSENDLMAMRDRIRLKGVNVLGPVNHGFCKSIYFAGPENLTLEISTSERGIDPRVWIDPAVARQVGISEEELALYRQPPEVAISATPVAQPPIDPSKPHAILPGDTYRQFVEMSDAAFAAMIDDPTPPVAVPAVH